MTRSALSIATLLAVLAAAPASAQFADDPPLSRGQVLDLLSRRGFEPLSRPRYNGDAYVVDALSPRGNAVRLVVDPYDGQVIRRVNLEEDPREMPALEGPPPWVRRFERRAIEEEVRPEPRPARPVPTVRVEPPAAPKPAAPVEKQAPAEKPAAEKPTATAPQKAPEPPRVRTSPSAPAPTLPTAKSPEPQPEKPTASATPQGPRTGPVRVIQGVTPVLPRSMRGADEIGVAPPDEPGDLKLD